MFEKLPSLRYPYEGGIEMAGIVLANLPSRLNIDRSYIIERKFIADAESPEGIAHRLYKRADLHWVTMYINSICDPYTEWPIPEAFLRTYADLKYGVNSIETIHHLLDTQTGEELDPGFASPPYPHHITPVSYFMHEQNLNNAKREVIAISPRYIHQFVDFYNELIAGKPQ